MKKLAVLGYLALMALLLTAPKAFASGNTTCNGTLNSAHVGNVSVPAGGVCRMSGTTVNGSVTVLDNAYLETAATHITGSIQATNALTVFLRHGSSIAGSLTTVDTPQVFLYSSSVGGDVYVRRALAAGYGHVQVCGVRVGGSLQVEGVGPDVLVGDPAGACPGNQVHGGVEIDGNATASELQVGGNHVGGDLVVVQDAGRSPKNVQDNTVGGELICNGNTRPFVGSLNTVKGAGNRGQCE